MDNSVETRSNAQLLFDYFKNTNNSIWLREGLSGSINQEVESFSSLVKNLEERKRMFENISLMIVPFRSSGEHFEITIRNNQEKQELIGQLRNYQNSERNENPFGEFNSTNNKILSIMENPIFQTKKAELQVKIDLPNNQEKPFFDKMSTPNNLVSVLQKAGQKLNSGESLNVSINGNSFTIPKEQTEKPGLLDNVTLEYDKAKDLKNQLPEENKNLQDLKDQIKFLGFGEDEKVHKQLAENISTGQKEFVINISSDKASFKNNEINFELKFQKSESNDKFYLNTFLAQLKNSEKDLDRSHTFSAKGNYTAKEAINLLEGRSIKTEVYNKHSEEKENAFVKLVLNEEKNEKGNYKLQVFNKNYGIDVAKIIDKAKLEFDNEKHREITTKSLEKGNIVSVKFSNQNNKITEGKAILNPQYKMLNLYDNKMKRINSTEQSFQRDSSEANEAKHQQNYSRKM